MRDLKLLLIVTVHFKTCPISLNVGRPAFFKPMSRGFPIDLTPSLTLLATFLMDLIINLALFLDGGLDLGFPSVLDG